MAKHKKVCYFYVFFFFNPQLCVIAYPHEPRVIRRFLTVGAVVLVDGSIVGYGPATVIEPSYVRVYVYKCKTEEIIKKKKIPNNKRPFYRKATGFPWYVPGINLQLNAVRRFRTVFRTIVHLRPMVK